MADSRRSREGQLRGVLRVRIVVKDQVGESEQVRVALDQQLFEPAVTQFLRWHGIGEDLHCHQPLRLAICPVTSQDRGTSPNGSMAWTIDLEGTGAGDGSRTRDFSSEGPRSATWATPALAAPRGASLINVHEGVRDASATAERREPGSLS
jgi:hypothetical protein